ncbi:hypothetical protein K1719_029004 [Acacia pycnantha]|nr:hypothetical protein K1719_029004 [Acacia pycnantha]
METSAVSDSSSVPVLLPFFSVFLLSYLIAYFIVFRNWSPKIRPEASSCFISLLHGTPPSPPGHSLRHIHRRYVVSHGAFAILFLLILAEVTSLCQNVWTLAGARRNDVQIAAKVAKVIEVAPIRVYEVATFYSMFNRTKESTIGAAFFSQTLAINDATVKFEIWDTVGQERYHSLAPMYYRGAAAAIIVYDITDELNFAQAGAAAKASASDDAEKTSKL